MFQKIKKLIWGNISGEITDQTDLVDYINDQGFLTAEDLSSTLTLYPTTASSDIGGYYKLVSDISDVAYDEPAVDVPTGAISGSDQLLSSLVSAPGLIVGTPGVVNLTIVGNIRKVTGATSTDATFHFHLFKRDALGVETEIGVSDNTRTVSNAIYEEFSASLLFNDGVWSETDRIVLKFYGEKVGGGVDPTYEFQFGGETPVRALLPVPVNVLLSGYLKTDQTTPQTTVGRFTFPALTVDTNTLYVDSTNHRVGILTTTPAYSAHIKPATGASTLVVEATGASSAYLGVYAGATGQEARQIFYLPNASTGNKFWRFGASSSGGGANTFRIEKLSDDGSSITETPLEVNGSNLILQQASGKNLAVGTTSASAKVHAIATTEQLRIGYDTSNYWKATTDSTGLTTFGASGTGAYFRYNNNIGIKTAPISGTALAINGVNDGLSGSKTIVTTLATSMIGYGLAQSNQQIFTQWTPSANTDQNILRGTINQLIKTGSYNVTSASLAVLYGNYAVVQGQGAGNIKGMASFGSTLGADSGFSGTITNAIHFLALSPLSAGGTITNCYGIYIEEQKKSVVTNSYGVYQISALDVNYFNGKTGFGTPTPTGLLDVNADLIRIRTSKTPTSASSAGNQGEIAWDSSFIYVCTATNTWKKSAIATW